MSPNEKGRPAGTAATLKTASNTTDSADNTAETQPTKPEIDLGSWSALGTPSRDRRQKKAWRRQRGMVDASLAAHLLLLAVLLWLLVAHLAGWPL